MALSMVLLALNGAAAHVGSTPGLWQKARLAALLAYLFAKEIVGFAAIIPSATRAFLIYSSLPSHPLSHLGLVDGTGKDRDTCNTAHRRPKLRQRRWRTFKVSIARDIRYAEAKRNLLDVYVPQAETVEGGRPVVMFVHGGIWASGSKEVFSHVGACLANHGVLAIVIQYTLFPEVLAWQQAREVSRALSWVLDNAVHYGGNPGRVTLMGHSAGAHLAALVLWERFKAGQQLQQRRAASGATTSQEAEIEWNEHDFDEEDVRQPCKFVGLAGVYDIVEHLKHEQKRGVASMSCMSPAMGGLPHLLEAMSPVRLFHSVVSSRRRRPSLSRDFLFPSCTLLCSSSDTVVPPDTSLSFNAVLQQQLGLDSRLILLDSLRHGDFVVLDGSIPELVSLRNHILDIVDIAITKTIG